MQAEAGRGRTLLMANADKGAAILDAAIAQRPRVATAAAWRESVKSLWKTGLSAGETTGWSSLDKHYTVAEGQFTIVTGWPSSGKSEWLDALLINIAKKGWKIAMFSPENHPVQVHIAKLAEKISGKPFGHGPTERIAESELDGIVSTLGESFSFVESVHGAVSIKDVIEAATPFLSKFEGKRGLVIDPWNELEHWRPQNLSETEYVSQTLSYVRNWARNNKVHVWIVAHPQKMRREDGKLPIPRPDMISGSQHWWNKSDCAITVWRDFDNLDSQDVDIYVQKVRFKHIGRPGLVTLKYDRVNGRYRETPTVVAIDKYRRASGGDD